MNIKVKALALHLECSTKEVEPWLETDDTRFRRGSEEYLVLTDSEADAAANVVVKDQLWAFRTSYLASFLEWSDKTTKAIAKMQVDLCEDANDVIEALLGSRVDELIAKAIRDDGRGHSLSGYDGAEYEVRVDGVTLYVYRTN